MGVTTTLRLRSVQVVGLSAISFFVCHCEERATFQSVIYQFLTKHERAGSTNVIHLHGELLKVKSTGNENDIQEWKNDLVLGDACKNGHQLRPHIVWFGEDVPMIPKAINICETADVLIIIGTSMQVYPAASLMHYVPENTPTYFIDPKPNIDSKENLIVFAEAATVGIRKVLGLL